MKCPNCGQEVIMAYFGDRDMPRCHQDKVTGQGCDKVYHPGKWDWSKGEIIRKQAPKTKL